MSPCLPQAVRRLSVCLCVVASQCLFAGAVRAACPPGQSNPITSGAVKGHPPVILSNLGGGPTASFFALGAAGRANSGSLPASAWLINLGDLDGDGLPEYRVEAPGEGPGGWGDARTVGCPSTLTPSRPPLVLLIQHEGEDLDGDGVFDIFEDINYNARFDPWEDRDGDGRLTPRDGCEGVMREDVDCDGHIDLFYEDLNHNGVIDPGEDRDRDRHLDLISEDRNFNGILDPGEDLNGNRILDIGPYIEDRNRDQVLNDRPRPGAADIIYEYFPDGSRMQIDSWYPYGSFVPAPGGIVTALVAWNGFAYDLSDMPAPSRLIATPQDFVKSTSKP
jgi:hypothetical protein